jgi:hypothetical protein
MVNRTSTRKKCRTAQAHYQMLPGNRLRMIFHKKSMTLETLRLIFGQGNFEVPRPFDLPDTVLSVLKIQHFRIQAGRYAIREDSDYISVDF